MIKMKTRSSAKKRFTVLASGKIKKNKANKRHLLTKKASKRKRHLRGTALVGKSDFNRTKKMLPNG